MLRHAKYHASVTNPDSPVRSSRPRRTGTIRRHRPRVATRTYAQPNKPRSGSTLATPVTVIAHFAPASPADSTR